MSDVLLALQIGTSALERTLAIVDMHDLIVFFECFNQAANETLGTLGCSIDCDQTEWTFVVCHGRRAMFRFVDLLSAYTRGQR
jgi:hypothetical protein